MTTPAPGTVLDDFRLGELLHTGGMAQIYSVDYADGRAAPFPMVMKLPRMAPGDGAETIVSFEVEHQIMQALNGPHVPRLVAVGDLATTPYLVMEHVPGHTLDHWLQRVTQGQPLSAETLGALGAAVATAAHALHQQNAVHLDLKPANVIVRDPSDAAAIAAAVAHAAGNDVILVAGKGHEDYQEIQGVRRPFSDMEQAQTALSLRAAKEKA